MTYAFRSNSGSCKSVMREVTNPNCGISVLRTMTRWHYQRWHSRLINVFTPWARIFLYKTVFAKSTNFLIWILSSSGILGRVGCFRTKVSGLHIGSIFKVASYLDLRCIIAQKTDEFSSIAAKAYNLATPLCVEPGNWLLCVEQTPLVSLLRHLELGHTLLLY
jgi:hypothetical protein